MLRRNRQQLVNFRRQIISHSSDKRLLAIVDSSYSEEFVEGFVLKDAVGSKLKYREEVEEFARASQGELSSLDRQILDALRLSLGLLPEEAAAIGQEVLQPYQERKKKLQQYKQALIQAFRREYPVGDDTRNGLKRLQEVLGLEEEDVAPIEAKIVQKRKDSVWTNKLALVMIGISFVLLAGIGSWAVASLLLNYQQNQTSPESPVSGMVQENIGR